MVVRTQTDVPVRPLDAILEAFGDAGDVVILSGDVHVGLAMDLPRDRHDDRAVAVELVTTSLTSQNVDDKMGWEPRTGSAPMERAWVEAIPYEFRGLRRPRYVIVDVTPERVRGEWCSSTPCANPRPASIWARPGRSTEARPGWSPAPRRGPGRRGHPTA